MADKPQSKLPPADMPASVLWTEITKLPRAHRLVDFPRKKADGASTGQLAIIVLKQEETLAAQGEAEKFAKATLKRLDLSVNKAEENTAYTNIFQNELAAQVLYRACKRAEDMTRPAFPSAGELRRELTTDEIGVLSNAYVRTQAELGPILAEMTDEEREVWIERLVEAGDTLPLAFLSQDMHDRLTLFLARAYLKSRTANTSPGSQDSGGENAESQPETDSENLSPSEEPASSADTIQDESFGADNEPPV